MNIDKNSKSVIDEYNTQDSEDEHEDNGEDEEEMQPADDADTDAAHPQSKKQRKYNSLRASGACDIIDDEDEQQEEQNNIWVSLTRDVEWV